MSDTDFHGKVLNAGASFNSTCWTEIVSAGAGDTDSLDEFCRQYWHPLYAFARRSGKSSAEAQDLTQNFFTVFLKKEKLKEVEREKGRFRNFLLILFKRFMINEFNKELAEKRGGKLQKVDFDKVEEWLSGQSLSPEELYNKSWALTIIDQVFTELEKRFSGVDGEKRFRVMRPFLDNSTDKSYKDASEELGCTENSFKVAMHRLRKEFGKLLRLKIQNTLEDSSEIEDELRFLSDILKK